MSIAAAVVAAAEAFKLKRDDFLDHDYETFL